MTKKNAQAYSLMLQNALYHGKGSTLWQCQPICHYSRKIRRSQPSNRISARNSSKALRPTALVSTFSNIVKYARVPLYSWINKSYTALPNIHSRRVHKRYYAAKRRRTGTSTIYVSKFTVNGNHVVYGGNICS